MRPLIVSFLVALSAAACSRVDSLEGGPVGALDATGTEAAAWDSFGGEVPDGTFVSMADVVANEEENRGKTLLVEGPVAEVCKKAGCWMTMRAGDEDVRVTFQDYGFFVPLDAAGRTVRLVGTFDVKMTKAAEVRHYLEDAGKLEEAAKVTEDRREYVFVATGVRMQPAAPPAAGG